MAGKTKPFVPMLISFNEEGYQIAQKQAEEKLMVLDEGAVWVNNQFCLEDSPINMRRFHNDMVEHFKDIVLHYYKDKNQLGLSATKLIEVKEIPIMGLLSIKERYEKVLESVKAEKYAYDNDLTFKTQREAQDFIDNFNPSAETVDSSAPASQATLDELEKKRQLRSKRTGM